MKQTKLSDKVRTSRETLFTLLENDSTLKCASKLTASSGNYFNCFTFEGAKTHSWRKHCHTSIEVNRGRNNKLHVGAGLYVVPQLREEFLDKITKSAASIGHIQIVPAVTERSHKLCGLTWDTECDNIGEIYEDVKKVIMYCYHVLEDNNL